MPDIRASAEVRALIGTESLGELEKYAFRSYECSECGKPGTTTDPTSVIVHRYRRTAIVRLAHARCSEPRILEFDADAPAGGGPADDWAGMRAMALVLGYPDEPRVRPLLLLEHRVETAKFTPGGERINMTLAAVLTHGLALIPAGDHMPALATGWRLLRPDRSSVILSVPDGGVAYRGDCVQPGDWAGLVDAAGACVVLIGTIGLYGVPARELVPSRVHQMLDEAARAGSLAGALVACPRDELPGAGLAPAAELAGNIRRFWHPGAMSGGGLAYRHDDADGGPLPESAPDST